MAKLITKAQLKAASDAANAKIDEKIADVNSSVSAVEDMIDSVDSKVDAVDSKVADLISEGGEPNVIEAIYANGEKVEPSDKAVWLYFQTKEDVDTKIAEAIAELDHLKRVVVDSVNDIDTSDANADRQIYMVNNASAVEGNCYDEYMIINGSIERVGDWAVDLADYITTDALDETLADYMTSEEIFEEYEPRKAALDKYETTNARIDELDESAVKTDDIATDEEIAAMLAEVFGTAE